jgi:DedD protein
VSDDAEQGGAGFWVTLLGAALLLLLGFGVGLVVGAARQEPALVLRHLGGEGETVPLAPPPATDEGSDAPPAAPARSAAQEPAPDAAAEPGPFGGRPRARETLAGDLPAPRPLIKPAGSAPAPPAATPPAVAAAPPAGAAAAERTGPFSIQVGAFAESGQAKTLAAKLERRGYAVSVSPGTGAQDSRWRVRVGPVASRAEADRLAQRLQKQDKLPTWILDESR